MTTKRKKSCDSLRGVHDTDAKAGKPNGQYRSRPSVAAVAVNMIRGHRLKNRLVVGFG